MTLEGLRYYLSKPHGWFFYMASRGWFDSMSDERFLKYIFRYSLGYPLNLENPRTYNEKLQYLKLHDRKSVYTTMVDKYAVRDYAAGIIGDQYLIPLVGGPWDSVEEIDFDALPDAFVLKCTHDCGGHVICPDKSKLDRGAAIAKLSKHLKNNYYYSKREWPYKDVKPRIMAEKYMAGASGDLWDYKVMCFHGVPRLIQVHKGRFGYHTQDFYDTDWNRLPLTQDLPLSETPDEKPVFLPEMLRLSSVLAADCVHLRVDWYYVEGQLYLGELTLYDASGLEIFEPPEYDRILGDMIDLGKM